MKKFAMLTIPAVLVASALTVGGFKAIEAIASPNAEQIQLSTTLRCKTIELHATADFANIDLKDQSSPCHAITDGTYYVSKRETHRGTSYLCIRVPGEWSCQWVKAPLEPSGRKPVFGI